jgi:hypothetical protein
MPLPADDAVSRRDHTLVRMRRTSRWITAAAVAAAVTLGSAFAHALPARHGTARAAAVTPAGPGAGQARRAGQGPARHHRPARRHHHLSPPPQPPAPTSTPTPPPVVSGGS